MYSLPKFIEPEKIGKIDICSKEISWLCGRRKISVKEKVAVTFLWERISKEGKLVKVIH